MSAAPLPYKLACLCDLRDREGRILLIHRNKSPNKGLCSPIGGKLDMETGESPAECAQREIEEEAGIHVPLDRIHLGGLISERGFEGTGHWLLFYFRVLGAVEVTRTEIREGKLAWHRPEEIEGLPLPETDRQIIWPTIRAHDSGDPDVAPGFFSMHIDCRGENLVWRVDQQIRPAIRGV